MVPEHIGTFIGEWSGFKVGDILEEYDEVYAMIRLYNSDNEPVYFTYHNPNTNRDYSWSTVSASAYSGRNDEYTLGLTNVYYPHIYWDKTKEEFFFYGGKVNDCAYYTAEFYYVVGTDDNGDDVERKESFIVLQNMPAFLPERNKSFTTYYDINSGDNEFYFDIYDPTTREALRGSWWFDWGGKHSAKLGAEGSNDYLWNLRQGRSGYTAEGAESYYRSLNGPYSGYLMDQFSLKIERENIPSYIETNINYEDQNAGFDRMEFVSHASILQAMTSPDENVSVHVSHPFFDNGCTIYPTWSTGIKTVTVYDTQDFAIMPTILDFGGGFTGLAVQAESNVYCDLTIQIKNVYSNKVYTFTISEGERLSNEYVDFGGSATVIPQGISISPDVYTVVEETSTDILKFPYRHYFDDTLEESASSSKWYNWLHNTAIVM